MIEQFEYRDETTVTETSDALPLNFDISVRTKSLLTSVELTERERVCVCVCACVIERKKEMSCVTESLRWRERRSV